MRKCANYIFKKEIYVYQSFKTRFSLLIFINIPIF
jgi:hypothetical protein